MCLHNIPINPYARQEQLRHNDQEQVTFTSKVNASKSKYVLDKNVLNEAMLRKLSHQVMLMYKYSSREEQLC